MRRSTYGVKLLAEVTRYARHSRAYWMVPLIVILGLTSLVIIGTQVVAPLIYALF